jgi:hypothetical protein
MFTTEVLLVLLFMAGQHARAADPMVITLSCDGTVTDTSSTSLPIDRQPKPVEKMGVVANLNERSVSFMNFVAPIASVDAASISFNGEGSGQAAQIGSNAGYTTRIDGLLDRVTGHMGADIMIYGKKQLSDPNSILTREHFDVLCKATNRVF